MFCKNCGQELNDNAIICPHCGVATDNYAKRTSAPAQQNTLAIVGFILSFFCAVAGLIISIIAYQNAKKPEYNGDGKSFAFAGIIISAVVLGLGVFGGIIGGIIGCNSLIWYL